MFRASGISVVFLAFLSLGACSKQEEQREEQPAVTVAPVAQAAPSANDAKKYFKDRCVVCHGTTGAGDGPGAAALDPKPRAFSDASWQDGISDDELAKVITDGGVAVGKSTGMPAHPDLKAKPPLLKDLVALVRDFRKE